MKDGRFHDRDRFIAAMSRAANSVNVVTTDGPAGRAGVTVSAMSSVSADSTRPTLLVCIHHLSPACSAILGNRVFCVNVLRDDQSYIADTFAGRIDPPGEDKFSCARWSDDAAPRVIDPLVAFQCELAQEFKVGSHVVFVGEVIETFILDGHAPLIYSNRAYGTPSRLDWTATGGQVSPDAGVLRLGCFFTLAPSFLPGLIAKMLAASPGIELHLIEGHQGQIVEALRASACEIALTYDMQLDARLVREELAAVKPYVLLPARHQLASAASVSLSELLELPLILLETPPSRQYFLELFHAAGLEPNLRLKSTSFETVRGLVGRGLGYSILATRPANSMTYDGCAVVAVPIRDAVPPSRLVLTYVAEQPLSRVAAAFLQLCREEFSRK
ncbi:MAG: LysR substrate-binding domain-containing protein [Rhodobacteraceae bacterium]|nr:LysR substrate-binding domain-containing protein [Paracoccaceae bacterium]